MITASPSLRVAEPGMHPLHYYASDFLHAKATKARKTVTFYELALRLYTDHVGLHWPPTDSSINSFLASCKERGCKDGTLHAYYRALRTWCNWLYKRKKIEENPIELVEKPKQPKPLPRAPAARDIQTLLQTLEVAAQLGKWNHVRDLAIIDLMYETGARVGEIIRLEMDDLSVRFNAALLRTTKTGRDRTIYFAEKTREELENWLRVREELNVPSRLTCLFVSQHRAYMESGPLTDSGVRQALYRWCQRAHVPYITPHALRHAYAIHALRSGTDLLDVQRQLGHENLSTTQRYTRVIDAGRRERHIQHSPRVHLDRIASEEGPNSKTLIPNKQLRIVSK